MLLTACVQQPDTSVDLSGVWRVAPGFQDPALPLASAQEVHLPVRPNEIFPHIEGPVAQYSVETVFTIDPAASEQLLDPAFVFPIIGEGFRVFLNGREIVSNLSLTPEGDLAKVTSGRGRVVPFPQHYLRPGENRLLLHLAGYTRATPLSSNSLYFGLPVKGGYRLGSQTALRWNMSEIALYAFTAIYSIFALYNLLYFARRRNPSYTLYFALFTVAYSIYLMCLSNRAFASVSDVRPLIRTAYAAQPAAMAFFILFLSAYFEAGRKRYVRAAATIDVILVLLALVLPYRFMQSWIIVFYAALVPQFLLILYILFFSVKSQIPDSRVGAVSFSVGLGFIAWDILDTLVLSTNVRLSRYAHFPVILSMMLMVVNRSMGAMAEVEELNRELSLLTRDLDRRVQERTRQFEAAMQSAERANRAKTSFLANMSHEIRTPLNVILGMGDWLYEREKDAEKRNALGTMLTAGNSLLTLIQELLDVARIEAGTVRLDSRVFDPELIARESVEFFLARAEKKSLRLEYNPPHSPAGHVLGDPDRLRQVLVNLLGNAVKFTEAGKVSLSIEVRDRTDERLRLHFSVQDSGPGVPADQARMIFERFSQGDSSMNRRHAGTGLGLSISQDLVGLMGGRIELHSREGAGAKFSFELDFRRAMESQSALDNVQQSPEERPLRILVAEDNEPNRSLLSAYFARTPHTLEFAHDGREALASFEARHFDLILMDIMMPEMDGIEATVRIRELEQELLAAGSRPCRVPIVALSAAAYAEDVAMSRQAGCDEHMAKPVKKVDLFRLVARVTAL